MSDDGDIEAFTVTAGSSGSGIMWRPKIVIPGPPSEDKKKCPFCGGAMILAAHTKTDAPNMMIYECTMCGFRASFYVRSRMYPTP